MKYILLLLLVISMTKANYSLLSPDVELSDREYHSVKLAKDWVDNGNKSFRGQDGSVNFLYGATLPKIVTGVLRFTDIQLQPGEKILSSPFCGDTVRWDIHPTISGSGSNEISHVIIKPKDAGLETTLAIFTNKRTYHLAIKSHSRKHMPIVGFRYKDDIDKQWSAYQTHINRNNKSKLFAVTSGGRSKNINSLDFNYNVSGSANWKPKRVYNDGIKTYIQMPSSVKYKEAPILMVLDSSSNKQLVNYRLKNDRYVVDKLFDEAILIIGVGNDQEKVLIQRSLKHKASLKSNLNVLNSEESEY